MKLSSRFLKCCVMADLHIKPGHLMPTQIVTSYNVTQIQSLAAPFNISLSTSRPHLLTAKMHVCVLCVPLEGAPMTIMFCIFTVYRCRQLEYQAKLPLIDGFTNWETHLR